MSMMIMFDFFGVKPDHSLKVMSKNQTLSSLTSKIISKLEKIIDEEQPDIIIVHGDTTSSFCGAIAAYYKKIKIAHVEAGLRTGDKFSPWPEEGNRKIVASISDMHFAPTQNAFNALVKEGVPKDNIKITGNTVIDAIKLASIYINKSDNLLSQMKAKFSFLDNNKKIILVTGHRRESFGEGFKNICNAIKRVAISNKDVQIC